MPATKLGNSGSSGGAPSTLVLKIGESEFGRIVLKSINNAQKQAGVTLLEV